MRRGDDNAGVGAKTAGHIGHARRGQRADEEDIDTHRENSGRNGVLEHVAGKPGVFADDDAVTAMAAGLGFEILENMAGRAAQLERGFGGDGFDVGPASDAVGSEYFLG